MSRRPGALPVVWAAVALFLLVFAGLAFQLRSGNDPAIGAPEAAPEPRQVLVRRIIQRRVIVRRRPTSIAAPAAAPPSSSGPAPAAAPAAPAAPAPAPVTRSS
jgi:hypothetical protein